MSYESPITMYTDRIVKDIIEKQEGYLVEEVQRVGFNIDKAELTKALKYDRDQYEQGYRDGRMYKPPIVTNADKIRTMTDDELYDLLWNGVCNHIPKCTSRLCSECVHSWLKSPIEKGE